MISHETDLTQLLWLKWVESELSQISRFGIWVESELSQSRKVKCWVESELSQVSRFGIWVESKLSQSRKIQCWVESELSQVSRFGIWVESELCQSRNVKCWVESESNHLDCHMSQSRVSPKNMRRAIVEHIPADKPVVPLEGPWWLWLVAPDRPVVPLLGRWCSNQMPTSVPVCQPDAPQTWDATNQMRPRRTMPFTSQPDAPPDASRPSPANQTCPRRKTALTSQPDAPQT